MKDQGLVQWLEQIMTGFGAGWVLWLMIGLSVISVAIILERLWLFLSMRDDLAVLARDLRAALMTSTAAALDRMKRSPSAEAAVVVAGLTMHAHGVKAAEQAMEGAAALQRTKLQKRLTYLATVGNNAPFIGLFGTVIGVMGAFKELDRSGLTAVAEDGVNKSVMGEISEALVATAVGIAVAIPAVAANNYFQRATSRTLANTEALTKVLLAHMSSTYDRDAADEAAMETPSAKPSAASEKGKAKGKSKSKAKPKADDVDDEDGED